MALAWLTRVQCIGAVGVLIWLAAALGQAARDGFEPARERYANEYHPAGVAQLLLDFLPAEGPRVVAVLGDLAAAPDSREAIEQTLAQLAEQGVELRACDLSSLDAAARGAHLLCVVEDRPEHRRLDWPRLRETLATPVIADFTTLLPDGEADAAGIELLSTARPGWPAWLDPEFKRFVAHVRDVIPDEAAAQSRILFVPGQPYRTSATRSRWFLLLNYALAPRRIHMWQPSAAGGYVMQYFGWVERVNEPARWQDPLYVRIADRALSRLDPSPWAPTRALTPTELAAADAIGAEWVLLQTPNVDFRLVDWELLPLDRVRGWSRNPR